MLEIIDSLRLKNFQLHKDSQLDFSKGINVLLGESDEGKSSIIRAMHWLFFNDPSGDEFVKWNASECTVEVISNENSIQRIRGKNANRYVINNQKFDAIRTNVPKEVEDIIKIHPVNIQMQDDFFYILFDRPGDIAKKLNRIVGIEQIDKSLAHVNLLYSRENSKIKHLNEQIEKNEERLQKYKNIKEIDKKYENYQSLTQNVSRTAYQIKRILSIVDEAIEYKEILHKEKSIKKLQKKIDELEKLRSKEKTNKQQINRINNAISSANEAQETINKIEPYNEKLKSLIAQIEDCIKEEADLDFDLIKNLNVSLKSQTKLVERLKEQKEIAEYNLEQFKKKIKICPLCEQTLS